MTTVSSAGIGSGLDVNSIITQLMAVEKQPLNTLQTKASTIQSTVSAYGAIKSSVSTLNDLATKLASATTWAQTTVASSNTSAVTATASGATPGSYSVQVQSLASVQTLASSVFASSAATPGAGTLNIELGTWGPGQTSFTPKSGATSIDITVAATDTLNDVRDKINAAGAGVTALIMTDAGGSRLLMRSNTSGADNAFRTSGVSALSYDTASKVMTQNQTAANAAATVNGLAVTSSTNTLTNIVDGLTLNLAAVTTGAVNIDVATDKDSLKKTLTDFAAAYSAVVTLIGTDTKYDAASKTGGVLQGDSSAVGLQRQLRMLAGSVSGASTTFGHLSDTGLQLQRDGSMTVDATKLDNALANLSELKKVFANSNFSDPTQDGFGKRFRVMTGAMLGIDGSLTTRTDGLAKQLQRNQTDQDNMNVRLTGIEARMRAQYTALDATMAQLNSSSSYITQQLASWTASGK